MRALALEDGLPKTNELALGLVDQQQVCSELAGMHLCHEALYLEVQRGQHLARQLARAPVLVVLR